jgi:hypothetical protein
MRALTKRPERICSRTREGGMCDVQCGPDACADLDGGPIWLSFPRVLHGYGCCRFNSFDQTYHFFRSTLSLLSAPPFIRVQVRPLSRPDRGCCWPTVDGLWHYARSVLSGGIDGDARLKRDRASRCSPSRGATGRRTRTIGRAGMAASRRIAKAHFVSAVGISA